MFQPSDDTAPADTSAIRTVLFVGGLEPVKDPVAMLRIFGRVSTGRPDLLLDVVGDGPLRAKVEREAIRLGLDGRVRLLGQVHRADMPERYRAGAVLVVSSRHEGQSMVAVEAAASGLPVVGTRVGVLPDLGDGARTVPVGDEAGLADAIGAVLDHPDRAATMGRAGRRVAVAAFDLDRTSAALLDRYESLVSGDAGRGR
jgi:glycosyltransferase involved in cell wall biosynthesis